MFNLFVGVWGAGGGVLGGSAKNEFHRRISLAPRAARCPCEPQTRSTSPLPGPAKSSSPGSKTWLSRLGWVGWFGPLPLRLGSLGLGGWVGFFRLVSRNLEGTKGYLLRMARGDQKPLEKLNMYNFGGCVWGSTSLEGTRKPAGLHLESRFWKSPFKGPIDGSF